MFTSNNLKIKRLSHVSLSTKDFKKVEKFYCDILGMQIVHKFVNPQNEIYGLFLHAGNSTFLTGLSIPVDGGTRLLSQESIAHIIKKFW